MLLSLQGTRPALHEVCPDWQSGSTSFHFLTWKLTDSYLVSKKLEKRHVTSTPTAYFSLFSDFFFCMTGNDAIMLDMVGTIAIFVPVVISACKLHVIIVGTAESNAVNKGCGASECLGRSSRP